MAEKIVGMLLYPGLTQLDLTGPYEVLARVPGWRVELVWKTLEPVRSENGLTITPTVTFDDCPDLDILFVPGGPGQIALMDDEAVLGFLDEKGSVAEYVTSVCTGSLLLGAAGLLEGKRATSHWGYREILEIFGAKPVDARVVVDGNRITGGGVTSGIDFALKLVAQACGAETAQLIQLVIEYDPAPPFDCGTPDKADPALVEKAKTLLPR